MKKGDESERQKAEQEVGAITNKEVCHRQGVFHKLYRCCQAMVMGGSHHPSTSCPTLCVEVKKCKHDEAHKLGEAEGLRAIQVSLSHHGTNLQGPSHREHKQAGSATVTHHLYRLNPKP